MSPTEQLKEEHKEILHMLNILNSMCRTLDDTKPIVTRDMENIIEFIQVFADQCHHGKEEQYLFSAMVDAGVPKEGGPIGVMLTEHDMGRDYVKNMNDALERYKNGDEEAAKDISENAKKYIDLLTPHIQKEDNILYAIADAHLSGAKQEELLQRFDEVEKNVIGEGTHEKYKEMLERIGHAYAA